MRCCFLMRFIANSCRVLRCRTKCTALRERTCVPICTRIEFGIRIGWWRRYGRNRIHNECIIQLSYIMSGHALLLTYPYAPLLISLRVSKSSSVGSLVNSYMWTHRGPHIERWWYYKNIFNILAACCDSYLLSFRFYSLLLSAALLTRLRVGDCKVSDF